MNKQIALLSVFCLAFLTTTGCATSTDNRTAHPATSTPQTTSSNKSVTNNQTNANSPSTASNGTSPQPSETSSGEQLVRKVAALALKGQVYGVPYPVKNSNLEDIEHVWGQPNSQSAAGAGMYATFAAKNVAIGFNKGMQVFDVRSYSPLLQTIQVADVVQVLGQPGDVRTTSDSYVYMYPAGPDYQLLFVFSKGSHGQMTSRVNHVSVFYPQGTINLMAQTNPAPRVTIDNAPGTLGKLFTLSIQHAPNNYRLVELEWIPTNGSSVVDTYIQAVNNSKTASQIPGFQISGDGQTMSYNYGNHEIGQSGIVKVVYQATSGSALIGQSDSVTLK